VAVRTRSASRTTTLTAMVTICHQKGVGIANSGFPGVTHFGAKLSPTCVTREGGRTPRRLRLRLRVGYEGLAPIRAGTQRVNSPVSSVREQRGLLGSKLRWLRPASAVSCGSGVRSSENGWLRTVPSLRCKLGVHLRRLSAVSSLALVTHSPRSPPAHTPLMPRSCPAHERGFSVS
jgi:hypothetical protein